jgi:hypothetical protein
MRSAMGTAEIKLWDILVLLEAERLTHLPGICMLQGGAVCIRKFRRPSAPQTPEYLLYLPVVRMCVIHKTGGDHVD